MAGEVQTVALPDTVCCHRKAGWAAETIRGVRVTAPSTSPVNNVTRRTGTEAAGLLSRMRWHLSGPCEGRGRPFPGDNMDECRRLTLPGPAPTRQVTAERGGSLPWCLRERARAADVLCEPRCG